MTTESVQACEDQTRPGVPTDQGESRYPSRVDEAVQSVGRIVPVVIKRVLLMVPTALLSSIAVFGAMRLVPGGPAEARLGNLATPQAIAALNQEMGLDHSLVYQYLHWLGGVVHGDLGVSIQTGEPISQTVGRTLPVSLEIVGFAILWTLLIALPVGIAAGRRQGSRTDRALVGLSGIGLAIPDFFLAVVLVAIFAVEVKVFPTQGYVPLSADFVTGFEHLFLPSVTLGLGAGAIVVRHVRAALAKTLSEEYVRMARAMGIAERDVVRRVALRNALPTIFNVYGLLIVTMLGATVLVEQIFVLPGLGTALLTAFSYLDYPTIEGILVVYVGIVLLVSLLVDIASGIASPRLDVGRAS
jgi:peptide/nickel transport system permease protein